jgi:hypothetical protein
MYEDMPRRSKKSGGWGAGHIAVLALVAGGIWYAWTKGMVDIKKAAKIFDIGSDVSTSTIREFLGDAPEQAKDLQEKSSDIISKGFETLYEKPKDAVTSFAANVGQGALDSLRKETAQVLNLPSPVAPGASSVSLVRPVRQVFSLLLEADIEPLRYVIDWGDKKTDKGDLELKQSRIMDHAWSEPGDYIISVHITGARTGKQSFVFPITIQK